MRVFRLAIVCLLLPLFAGSAALAGEPTAPVVSLTGKVRQPQQFDLAKLEALPSQTVEVTYQTDHGPQHATFTGVLLWTLIDAAGGLADADKSAALHHTITITAKDAYFAVLSTGEIAPDLGGKPALIAYRRDDEPPGASGLRLVMPGDKHGARNVRDVTTIDIE